METGAKDRVTLLPEKLEAELEAHLKRVRALHDGDTRGGGGEGSAFCRRRKSLAEYRLNLGDKGKSALHIVENALLMGSPAKFLLLTRISSPSCWDGYAT